MKAPEQITKSGITNPKTQLRRMKKLPVAVSIAKRRIPNSPQLADLIIFLLFACKSAKKSVFLQ